METFFTVTPSTDNSSFRKITEDNYKEHEFLFELLKYGESKNANPEYAKSLCIDYLANEKMHTIAQSAVDFLYKVGLESGELVHDAAFEEFDGKNQNFDQQEDLDFYKVTIYPKSRADLEELLKFVAMKKWNKVVD